MLNLTPPDRPTLLVFNCSMNFYNFDIMLSSIDWTPVVTVTAVAIRVIIIMKTQFDSVCNCFR
jgi:hypothetical protein